MLGKLVRPTWNNGLGIIIDEDNVDGCWVIYKVYDFTTMTLYWVSPSELMLIG